MTLPPTARAVGALGTIATRVGDWGAGDQALLVGAGLVALAPLLAVAVVMIGLPSRVDRSLGLIDRLPRAALQARRARDEQLAAPLSARLLDPMLTGIVRLGRRLTPSSRQRRIQRRLDLAGNPPNWDVDRVVSLQVLSMVLLAALGITAGLTGLAAPRAAGLTLLGLVMGFLGPAAYISRLASARSDAIRRELPDSLDLLTISVEAGLSFDAAVAYVARNSRGPFAREMARMLQEMQIGTGRADALRAMGARTDVTELQTFTAALVQAEQFGVPMARALRIQAAEMRVRRRQRVEEKAQQVPIKILFPLIFGILPVLFLTIIGPAGIRAFQSFSGL